MQQTQIIYNLCYATITNHKLPVERYNNNSKATYGMPKSLINGYQWFTKITNHMLHLVSYNYKAQATYGKA